MDMTNFDLTRVFKEPRFLGVRLWLYTFPFAFVGFFFFLMGETWLGLTLFLVAWIGAVIGFFINLSRRRDPK
jgi:hypothetical protein